MFKKLNLKASVSNIWMSKGTEQLASGISWEPGGQLTLKKWRSEKLPIIKCISSVYFIAGFVMQWILCNPSQQRLAELMPLWVVQRTMHCFHFCWCDAFHKRGRNFVNILNLSRINVTRAIVVEGILSKATVLFITQLYAAVTKGNQFAVLATWVSNW